MSVSVSAVIAVLVAVAAVHVEAGNKLPSYIQTCHRNDPKVEECILGSVEKLRPMLVKGIPELDMPALDPLHLPEIRIAIGGPATFKAVGKDVIVHGAANFKVSHLRVDLANHLFRVHVDVPWMMMEGVFDIDGKFMVLPIRGRGPMRSNATRVTGEVELRSALEMIDGVEHLIFKSVEVDLKLGGFTARLNFNNDPVLTEAANIILASSPKEFITPMLPVLETTLGQTLLETANKLTRNYSYAEIFPAT